MSLLSDQDKEELKEMFHVINRPVRLLLAVQDGCATCSDTRGILEELGSLSSQIAVEVVELNDPGGPSAGHGLDRAPGLSVLGDGEEPADFGIRYFGIPSGYEFSSLIQDIIMVGTGECGLTQATRDALDDLDGPVHIQVFVTPTCPYCPGAVHLAHQMAFHSPWVDADMVEAVEFPELAQRFGVMGVPRTVINAHVHVEGAVPETALLPRLLEAAGQPADRFD